jgi:hypothetical protein
MRQLRRSPRAGRPAESLRPQGAKRYAAQRPEIVESRTGALDDYYNAQPGYSDDVVDKPRLKIDPTLARTIDAIAELGSPGWLSTATAVLELGWRPQREFARRVSDLARQSRRDGSSHIVTSVFPQFDGDDVIVVTVTGARGQDADDIENEQWLRLYLRAKKFQLSLTRASALLFDSSGTTLLRILHDIEPTRTPPMPSSPRPSRD